MWKVRPSPRLCATACVRSKVKTLRLESGQTDSVISATDVWLSSAQGAKETWKCNSTLILPLPFHLKKRYQLIVFIVQTAGPFQAWYTCSSHTLIAKFLYSDHKLLRSSWRLMSHGTLNKEAGGLADSCHSPLCVLFSHLLVVDLPPGRRMKHFHNIRWEWF